jgi:hypothetical protein
MHLLTLYFLDSGSYAAGLLDWFGFFTPTEYDYIHKVCDLHLHYTPHSNNTCRIKSIGFSKNLVSLITCLDGSLLIKLIPQAPLTKLSARSCQTLQETLARLGGANLTK